jgi:proteasome lid subunit RPN8/RPN11
MVLRVQPEHLAAIRRHAVADYPAECCGILLGQADGESKEIAEIVPVPNLRHDPDHAQQLVPLEHPGQESELNRYLIDPQQQLKTEKNARARGLTVLGYYHSHPDHPARPSEYDRERAWPWYSYVVVSVSAGAAENVQSWVLADDRSRFEPERLELHDRARAEAGLGVEPGSRGQDRPKG